MIHEVRANIMQKIKVLIYKDNEKIWKSIKINDNLFDVGLRKGLIEKEGDSYLFIGDYDELIAFTKENHLRNFLF